MYRVKRFPKDLATRADSTGGPQGTKAEGSPRAVSWVQKLVKGPTVREPGAKEPVNAKSKGLGFLETRE